MITVLNLYGNYFDAAGSDYESHFKLREVYMGTQNFIPSFVHFAYDPS